MFQRLLLIIFLVGTFFSKAQKGQKFVDSLKSPLKAVSQNKESYTIADLQKDLSKATHDTTRTKLFIDRSSSLGKNDPDSAQMWLRKGKRLIDANLVALKDRTDEASRFIVKRFLRFNCVYYQRSAIKYNMQGGFDRSLIYIDSVITFATMINDKKMLASAYNLKAISHHYQGAIKLALQDYEKASKLFKETNNMDGVATVLSNMAIIYSNMGEKENAIKDYKEAIALGLNGKDKASAVGYISNLAALYVGSHMKDSALRYFKLGLDICKETGDKDGEASIMYSQGVMEYNSHNFDQALDYFNRAKTYQEEKKNYISVGLALSSISNVYYVRKDYPKALEAAMRSYTLHVKLGVTRMIDMTAEQLSDIYLKLGEHARSLEYYKIHIRMKDSVENEGNRKAAITQQLKNDFAVKAAEDSVAHAKESEIKNVELKRQAAEIKVKKNQQYAMFGGLFILCLFGIFMYNRFKITQKQKRIIEDQKIEVEKQKDLVEVKQKEVLDSIRYAKRIQQAHMASEKGVEATMNRLRK